ncbi:hypothetical protein NMG60_11025132 [Bertholletia excelsa]
MEDTELEEGEACSYKDDASIDPDVALSYIGEKVQSVLGHFQKDFEGGVSAENLGAKFGGYGSFLPTYQRSPSIWSQPKSPRRVQNSSSPRSPNILPVEDAPQNSTAPLDAARPLRLASSSSNLHPLHAAKAPSSIVSTKEASRLSPAQVIEKSPLKHASISKKSVNPTELRPLKFRIKVGSDNIARKNAAIYSGLGLISPSSSMENSPDESGGTPSECQETMDESPTRILQIMTSFPIPGGLILSPLDDSLVCFASKKELSKKHKPLPAIRSGQQHSVALAEDSALLMEDRNVPKEKKMKRAEKNDNSLVMNQESDMDFDDNRTTLAREEVFTEVTNIENDPLGWKESFSKDTKLKPRPKSACNVTDSVKGSAKAFGVAREAERNILIKKRDIIKDRKEDGLSAGLVKEEILESRSGLDGLKHENGEGRSSMVEKLCESRFRDSRTDVSVDNIEDSDNRGHKVSVTFKPDTDVSKCKRDPNIGAPDQSKQKVSQNAVHSEREELKVSSVSRKYSFDSKKKLKGSQNNCKLASEAAESLMAGVHQVTKEKKKAGKVHKSQKEVRKVCDSYKDILSDTRMGQMNSHIDPLKRPSGDRSKESHVNTVEKECSASLVKLKEVSTHEKIDPQLASENFLKDPVNDCHPSTRGVNSVIEPTSMAPVLIEENWVACDHCQKWRLLPYGTKPDQLPEKWLCSMLDWLPGMNRCDISEEETTKRLHALYQLPLSENQNNLQNHVDQAAAGVSSANAWHFDANPQILGSHGMPNSRKKRQGSKGISYAVRSDGLNQIAGCPKDLQQEVVKSRSLNDMKEPIMDFNLTNSCNVQHWSKSQNFPLDNSTHKQKEKHAKYGDGKLKKLKTKREADQLEYGTVKKIKTDIAFGTSKLSAEQSGSVEKMGHGSVSGLPTKTTVKSMEKQEEDYYYKDAKHELNGTMQVSLKKQGQHGSVSLHDVSLDMKTYDERELSLKKRKLKDWQESQINEETSRHNGNHLPENKVFIKEESSDNEFRKAKKSKVSMTEAKELCISTDDDKLKKKGKVTRILLSGSRENPVCSKEEVKSFEKDQQSRKHQPKVASKAISDDMDPVKQYVASDQFSWAATSSSSKISDSRKSRTHIPEVKGSPMESVSSSPYRPSNLEKLSPARREIWGKDSVRNGDFPIMDSPRKSLDEAGNVESNPSGTKRRGKVLDACHSESLEFPMLDFRDNKASKKSGSKSSGGKCPPELRKSHLVKSSADYLENPCPADIRYSDRCNENGMNKNYYHDNALFSGETINLLSKDKDRSSANNFDRIKVKLSKPPSEVEAIHSNQRLRDEVVTCSHVRSIKEKSADVKCKIKPMKDDKSIGSRDFGKQERKSGRENHSEFGEHDSSAVDFGSIGGKDNYVTPQQNLIQDSNGVKVVKRSGQNPAETRGGNSLVHPHHAGKQDLSAHASISLPESQKDAIENLRYPIPSRLAFKGAPSPLRRDSSSHIASNTLKKAEDLRDYAERLKESGFGFECNEVYFQSVLMFLHGASLLETSNVDGSNSKPGEMSQLQIYSNTAKLCEVCAHEYEKRQEMAAAALAYKCMEVAYMRVVYCKNSITNRDRHDLQASLQMVPQGESPSSSASDVDNLNNNHSMVDRAATSRGISAHAGNHIIVAHDRPNFVRLLDFTKDVNSAMEASRKSQNAFAAATVILEEAQNNEGVISVKKVIDFGFQDVQELIRLVKLAIEAISRRGLSGNKD